MSKNLYITALEPKSGLSLITLGVMEFLVRNLAKVAFFGPSSMSSSIATVSMKFSI